MLDVVAYDDGAFRSLREGGVGKSGYAQRYAGKFGAACQRSVREGQHAVPRSLGVRSINQNNAKERYA